jgi:hypothetical protein
MDNEIVNNFKKKYYKNKKITDRLLLNLPLYFRKDEKIYSEIEDKLFELDICDDCLEIKDEIYELILGNNRGSYLMDEILRDINSEGVYTRPNEKSIEMFDQIAFMLIEEFLKDKNGYCIIGGKAIEKWLNRSRYTDAENKIIETNDYDVVLHGTNDDAKNFCIDLYREKFSSFTKQINKDELNSYGIESIETRFDSTLCFSCTGTPVYQIGYSYIKDNEIKTNYFIDVHASTNYGIMDIVEIESIFYINLKNIIENINYSLDYYKMEKRLKRKAMIEKALIDITKLNPYILNKILKSNGPERYTGYGLTIHAT